MMSRDPFSDEVPESLCITSERHTNNWKQMFDLACESELRFQVEGLSSKIKNSLSGYCKKLLAEPNSSSHQLSRARLILVILKQLSLDDNVDFALNPQTNKSPHLETAHSSEKCSNACISRSFNIYQVKLC